MTESSKKGENVGKDVDIRKAYKADRKTRPSHLIDEEEQRQSEDLRRRVVEAVRAGEGQKALDYLRQMGYGPDSPEYQTVIALLYPPGKKR